MLGETERKDALYSRVVEGASCFIMRPGERLHILLIDLSGEGRKK